MTTIVAYAIINNVGMTSPAPTPTNLELTQMEISPSAPRGTFTIQGIVLSIPQPFAEGHVCLSNEASVLNQTLAENMRNNCATKVEQLETKLKESGITDPDAIKAEAQTLVDLYLAEYKFGVRRAGGRTLDPVEKEARGMVEDQIKAAIRAEGGKLKDYEDIWDELIDQTLKDTPAFYAEAKKIVERRAKVGASAISLKLRPTNAAEGSDAGAGA